MQITIGNFKTIMTIRAKAKGIYENFGQAEICQLKEDYKYDMYANKYGNPKAYNIRKSIDTLDEWVTNLTLTQIKDKK